MNLVISRIALMQYSSVFCPLQCAGRLDRVYPLVMLSEVSKAVAEAAQAQLEFMSDSVGRVRGRKL
jgi:hypothetical protein